MHTLATVFPGDLIRRNASSGPAGAAAQNADFYLALKPLILAALGMSAAGGGDTSVVQIGNSISLDVQTSPDRTAKQIIDDMQIFAVGVATETAKRGNRWNTLQGRPLRLLVLEHAYVSRT
jgi:hypothetical protein